MSVIQETLEKRRPYPEFREDFMNKLRRVASTAMSPKSQVEHEKRVRREIANSNERRRMQSINTGFETLRTLLPPTGEGERLSKATILQMAAKYIQSLHNEVNTLKNQVTHYRQILPHANLSYGPVTDHNDTKKRKLDEKQITESYKALLASDLEDDMIEEDRFREVLADDFKTISKHSRPCDVYQLSCLGKPDYEQFVVEPDGPMEVASISTNIPVNQSIEIPSSRPESTSSGVGQNRSNCLEHLVMAIEQIEGRKVMSKDEIILQEERISSQTQGYTPHSSVIKPMISPYTERILMAASMSTQSTTTGTVTPTTVSVSSPNEKQSTTSQEYPIVTKLLNKPIPHKYLHRPQVIVNSSH